jgi:hypothetical protein
MTGGTSLADENEWARICLYGRYGSGKTTAAAAAARLGGQVVHIDAEQRLKAGPLRRPPLNIPIDRIEPYREISYKRLRELGWAVKERLHDQPGSVSAVTFDSVTEVTKLLVGQILDSNTAEAIRRAEKRGEEVAVNPFAIDIDWWGEMTEQFRRILRLYRDLECHLVFTAHERRDVDGDGVRIGPATTPAVQQDLMGYVDVLGVTYLDRGQYVARFAPGTKHEAKDAFGVLPPVMAQPTVDRIVAYVREELTLDNDPIQQAYNEMVSASVASTRADIASEVEGTTRRRRSKGGTS